MKRILFFLTLCTFTGLTLCAQTTLVPGTKIKDNKLYLKLENNTLRTFIQKDNEAGSEPLDEVKRFAMPAKYCNVYVEWLNPLHYQLKWSDSTFNDESDEAVTSYITKLVEMFGSPVSGLNKNNAESKAAIARSGLPAPAVGDLHYPPEGFKSLELTYLYLQLRQLNPALTPATPALTPAEIASINAITTNIEILDELNGVDIAAEADEQFQRLYNIKTAGQLEEELPDVKTTIEDLESRKFTPIENQTKSIPKALATLSLDDKFIEGYYKTVVTRFIEQAVTNLAANRELIKKFGPVIKLMEASVAVPGDVANAVVGQKTAYYKDREIKVADGKGLHTTVSLVEKEYVAKTHEFKTKSESKKGVMQFRRYDPVAVFVSAGVFGASTTLKGYGVDKDLKVTEDDIQKGNFVAALFLNFNFVPSRYISPLIQIGIDPTKKRPFMLLGGGFAIPVARIAISAGGTWTWAPALKDLQVGQVIASTTELEKDVSYKFSMAPKGWYLGIQYNF